MPAAGIQVLLKHARKTFLKAAVPKLVYGTGNPEDVPVASIFEKVQHMKGALTGTP